MGQTARKGPPRQKGKGDTPKRPAAGKTSCGAPLFYNPFIAEALSIFHWIWPTSKACGNGNQMLFCCPDPRFCLICLYRSNTRYRAIGPGPRGAGARMPGRALRPRHLFQGPRAEFRSLPSLHRLLLSPHICSIIKKSYCYKEH